MIDNTLSVNPAAITQADKLTKLSSVLLLASLPVFAFWLVTMMAPGNSALGQLSGSLSLFILPALCSASAISATVVGWKSRRLYQTYTGTVPFITKLILGLSIAGIVLWNGILPLFLLVIALTIGQGV